MSHDPDYLEECVRRLVKAARAVLNVLPSTDHHRADLARAIGFARPHANEAEENPDPFAMIDLGEGRWINPRHVHSVVIDRTFYANGSDAVLVVTMCDARQHRVRDTSMYLGGVNIYSLQQRINWAISAGFQR